MEEMEFEGEKRRGAKKTSDKLADVEGSREQDWPLPYLQQPARPHVHARQSTDDIALDTAWITVADTVKSLTAGVKSERVQSPDLQVRQGKDDESKQHQWALSLIDVLTNRRLFFFFCTSFRR